MHPRFSNIHDAPWIVQEFDGPVEGSVSQNWVWRSKPCKKHAYGQFPASSPSFPRSLRSTHSRGLEAAQVGLLRGVVARRRAARRATRADPLEEVHRAQGSEGGGAGDGGAREGGTQSQSSSEHTELDDYGWARKG